MNPVETGGHTDTFQVDLRGIVDLLARHLYASPRIYLRELLQNGVDAITARQDPDAGAVPRRNDGPDVTLKPTARGLEVIDTGIGLTADQARGFLATIGRSSKRELESGGVRDGFLGQFGIGLLSAFMVADEIELVSWSAVHTGEGRPLPIRWRGHANGRYELTEISPTDPDARVVADGGSLVRLVPRPETEHWLDAEAIANLARDFAEFLPINISVVVSLDDGSPALRRLTGTPCWEIGADGSRERSAAIRAYGTRLLGQRPLESIELDVPLAGLRGVAYVIPGTTAPGGRSRHRVYLKNMLLGADVVDLLPPWAFFVRCVVNVDALRPTASREGLYEDELLFATREALGSQIRSWVVATMAEDSPQRADFLRSHHLAVRAMALADDELLEIVAKVLPFETTEGDVTLGDLHERAPAQLLYATSLEEFRRLAPVAAAHRLPLVNGGYVYDGDLLARLATRYPGWGIKHVGVSDIAPLLHDVEPVRELETLDTVAALAPALQRDDLDVVVQRFAPALLPALLLDDREDAYSRRAASTASQKDDVWGQILSGLSGPPKPRRLVLNDDNPTVRSLLSCTDPEVRAAAVTSVFLCTVLSGGDPLAADDIRKLNEALEVLIRRASTQGPNGEQELP